MKRSMSYAIALALGVTVAIPTHAESGSQSEPAHRTNGVNSWSASDTDDGSASAEASDQTNRENDRSSENASDDRGTESGTSESGANDSASDDASVDREADWRFVEKDGTWWYRTPMDTWMVQRDGEWEAYQGHTDSGPQTHTANYRGGSQDQQDESSSADTRRDGERADRSDDGLIGSQPPRVGQQRWMRIDGELRRVTITDVETNDTDSSDAAKKSGKKSDGRESQNASQSESGRPTNEPSSNTGGDSSQADQQASQGGDQQASQRELTPPPVPQDKDVAKDDKNLPEAPSEQELDQVAERSDRSGERADRNGSERRSTRSDSAALASQANYAVPSTRPAGPRGDRPKTSPVVAADGARNAYGQRDLIGGPSSGLNGRDSLGGDAAPERR